MTVIQQIIEHGGNGVGFAKRHGMTQIENAEHRSGAGGVDTVRRNGFDAQRWQVLLDYWITFYIDPHRQYGRTAYRADY